MGETVPINSLIAITSRCRRRLIFSFQCCLFHWIQGSFVWRPSAYARYNLNSTPASKLCSTYSAANPPTYLKNEEEIKHTDESVLQSKNTFLHQSLMFELPSLVCTNYFNLKSFKVTSTSNKLLTEVPIHSGMSETTARKQGNHNYDYLGKHVIGCQKNKTIYILYVKCSLSSCAL